jgi:hypothetical protein
MHQTIARTDCGLARVQAYQEFRDAVDDLCRAMPPHAALVTSRSVDGWSHDLEIIEGALLRLADAVDRAELAR